ncbi:unnamed protein product [Trichobilharzia szidati]|nr:unnamed protein product [Trichobilharzia szidati]
MFGANKPTFGGSSSSAFGQSTTPFGATSNPQTQTGTNLFGQQSTSLGGTNTLFSGNQMNTLSWGSTNMNANGTSIAFNPPITTEILQRGGQPSQVNAKHMCITAMKEYQDKSLEELRLEDYALNRRGPSSTVGNTSIFATSSAAKPFQFGSSQIGGTTSIFGQANKPTSSLFGASTSGVTSSNTMLFGNTATQSAFGQASQGSLLGLKPQFGAATTASIFGTTPATQSTGFAFGQTNQTTSVFGAKPLFGATSTAATGTSLFGTAQTTPQLGNTGFTFGQPQQQATGLGGSTSLFGQSTQASTAAKPTLFGTQPTTGTGLMFGSTSTGIFGGSKPAGSTSVFGSPATGLTGLQGTQQQTGFSFGSSLGTAGGIKPAGTSLFGTSATTTTTSALKPGGLFGSAAPTGFTFGSSITNTSQPTAFGGLGTTSATGSLFGQPAANTLTPKKPFSFGTSLTTTSSGGIGTLGFGQTNTGTGLFGAPSASTGFNLGTGTGAASGSLFGQTSTGFGLGQKPLQNVGGVGAFGTGFGGSTAPTIGGFGGGGLLGGATQGLGGSTLNPLGSSLTGFGASNTANTGLNLGTSDQVAQTIRAQQQVLEVVRSMPYGQSSLFRYLNLPTNPTSKTDSKSQASGGILVNTSNSGSVGSVIVPAKSVANVLAERHRAAGLLIGSSPVNSSFGGNRASSFRRPANSSTQRLLQMGNRNKLFSGFYEEDALTSTANRNSPLPSSLRRTASLGPAAVSSPVNNTTANNNNNTNGMSNFFIRRDEWKHLHLPESIRNSILERSNAITDEFNHLAEKTLDNINSSSDFATVGSNNKQNNNILSEYASGDTPILKERNGSNSSPMHHYSTVRNVDKRNPQSPSVNEVTRKLLNTSSRIESPAAAAGQLSRRNRIDASRVHDVLQGSMDERNADSLLSSSPCNVTFGDVSVLRSPNSDQQNDTFDKDQLNTLKSTTTTASPNAAGVILTKPGYYTLPTLDELAEMVKDGKCLVEDFVIGRRLYGHILFPGITDVYGLNLDNIVHIRRREVVVYPDDEKKPPEGTSLNKRAEICLESIWPTDKSTREPIKSPERLAVMRFEERLERATRRMDARFIEYRPQSGSWVFEVKHFSKYRLDDSDDEGEGGNVGGDNNCEVSVRSDSREKLSTVSKTDDSKAKCLFDNDQLDNDEDIYTIYNNKEQTTFNSHKEINQEFQLKPYMRMKFIDDENDNVYDQFNKKANTYNPQSLFYAQPSYPTYDGILSYKEDKSDQQNDQLPQNLEVSMIDARNHLDSIDFASLLMKFYPYEKITNLCGEMSSLKTASQYDNANLLNHPSHWIVDAGLWHGHGMRPSFGCSRFPEFHSLVLICPSLEEYENEEEDEVERLSKNNSLTLYTLNSPIEMFDEDMLNSALTTSMRIVHTSTSNSSLEPPRDQCPLWRPTIGLSALESYTRVLNCDPLTNLSTNFHESIVENDNGDDDEERSARLNGFRRIFSLCQALWGRHPQETVAEAIAETDSSSDNLFNSKLITSSDFPILSENNPTWNNDEYISNEVYRKYNMINYPVNKYRELSGMRSLARKQAISEWIRTQSLPWLTSQLNSLGLTDAAGLNETVTDSLEPFSLSKVNSSVKDSNILAQGVFACLVSGESGAACRLAIVSSMPALASLIAQSTAGDPVVRRGLQHQLSKWHEMKFDQQIPINMLRVYCLLAGLTEFPHPTDSKNICVLAGLDWIQAFGAHIWYICDYRLNVAEVLEAYSETWHYDEQPNSKNGVPRPSPPTVDRLLDPKQPISPVTDYPINDETKGPNAKIDFRDWPRDTAYHLLELCRKPFHSLERTLNPCSFSRHSSSTTCTFDRMNLLDWSLSWHLWRFLVSYGYHHFYDDFSEDFMGISTRICNEFASQLEAAGLWEWSIFVLLHIDNAKLREISVKSLIGRHVSLVLPSTLGNVAHKNCPSNLSNIDFMSNQINLVPAPSLTKAELFVVNRLGVPVRWIHEAKAVLARHRLKAYLHAADVNTVTEQCTLTPTEDHRSQFCLFAILEASHWFAAGCIQSADEVLSKYILPQLIVNTNISPYSAFLSRFESVYSALGRRIAQLLEPYNSLTENCLPADFHLGVGVYRSFGELLCLVDKLTHFCKLSSIDSVYSPCRKRIKEDTTDLNHLDQLASILSQLKSKVASVTEEINVMKTTTFLEKVVRTEMAAVCIHLTSAFLAASCLEDTATTTGEDEDAEDNMQTDEQQVSNREQITVAYLENQLISMTKLGLPADYRLKELRAVAEVKLSLSMV